MKTKQVKRLRIPVRFQIASLLAIFVSAVALVSIKLNSDFIEQDKVLTVREFQTLSVDHLASKVRDRFMQVRQELRSQIRPLLLQGAQDVKLEADRWAYLEFKGKEWTQKDFSKDNILNLKQKLSLDQTENPSTFRVSISNDSEWVVFQDPITVRKDGVDQVDLSTAVVSSRYLLGDAFHIDRGVLKGVVALAKPGKAPEVWRASLEGKKEFENILSRMSESDKKQFDHSERAEAKTVLMSQNADESILAFAPVKLEVDGVRLVIVSFILKSDLLASFRRLLIQQGFWIVSLVGIGLMFAMWLSRRMSKPLEDLVAATKQLETGDFKVRVQTTRADEIGDLSAAFNHMGQSLHEREESLKAAQNALIQSEKLAALGTLSAGITHEVKNPLAGILGHAELAVQALKKLNIPENLKVWGNLETIQKEVKRCRGIIDGLMRFSRKEKAVFEEMDLEIVALESLSLVEHHLGLSGIKIEKNFDASLWMIQGHHNQVEQVLLNMMQNAGQAMGKNGVLRVSTKYYADPSEAPVGRLVAYQNEFFKGPFCRVAIQDNGSGMSEEVQKKIFEPFFTTKPAGVGTGLGLSVTMGILNDHKARVSLNSAPGEGTVFFIDFMAQCERKPEVVERIKEINERKGKAESLSKQLHDVAPNMFTESKNLTNGDGQVATSHADVIVFKASLKLPYPQSEVNRKKVAIDKTFKIPSVRSATDLKNIENQFVEAEKSLTKDVLSDEQKKVSGI